MKFRSMLVCPAFSMLALVSPLAQADIVELSPDLYLVVRSSRAESDVDLKVGAITEAQKFAAQSGRVAVPIAGRLHEKGVLLKVYEYQFRVQTRAEALAARPVLSEAVVTIHNSGECAPPPGEVITLLPDLSRAPALAALDPLKRIPPKDEEDKAPAAEPATPVEPPAPVTPPTPSAQ